jgi:hypothetical protein
MNIHFCGSVRIGMITLDQLLPLKNHFLDLLKSDNEYTRSDAWDKVDGFIKGKLLTVEDLQPLRNHFLDLLTSLNEYTIRGAWNVSNQLVGNFLLMHDWVLLSGESCYCSYTEDQTSLKL